MMKVNGANVGLTLSQSYDPYGNVIYTHGGDTVFGYTGEQQAQSLGDMVYLRARYYAPTTGTFLSRDTWEGDANLPMSYNRWLYTNGNPVNYTDPSGKLSCENGICIKSTSFSDRSNVLSEYIQNYNPEVMPPYVYWYSNPYAEKITRGKSPIFNNEGKFISDYDQAQFNVKGYYAYNEYNKKGKYTRACNSMYCGQLILAAVINALDPQVTADGIIDKLRAYHPPCGDTGTGAQEISDFLNTQYADYFKSIVKEHKESELPGYLRRALGEGKVIMPIVNMNTGYENQLGVENKHPHWVLITGVSAQWNYSNSESQWNWVRVLNPFDNRIEYYWWEDFKNSWRYNSSKYKEVSIKEKEYKLDK